MPATLRARRSAGRRRGRRPRPIRRDVDVDHVVSRAKERVRGEGLRKRSALELASDEGAVGVVHRPDQMGAARGIELLPGHVLGAGAFSVGTGDDAPREHGIIEGDWSISIRSPELEASSFERGDASTRQRTMETWS